MFCLEGQLYTWSQGQFNQYKLVCRRDPRTSKYWEIIMLLGAVRVYGNFTEHSKKFQLLGEFHNGKVFQIVVSGKIVYSLWPIFYQLQFRGKKFCSGMYPSVVLWRESCLSRSSFSECISIFPPPACRSTTDKVRLACSKIYFRWLVWVSLSRK